MSGTPRLLLVSPAFHGYWRAIQGSFERRGYAVQTYRYDRFAGLRAKARVKARYQLADRVRLDGTSTMRRDLTAAAVLAVVQADPDIVLVVKGDAFDAPFWDLLDARRQRRALWLYDELRRTQHTHRSLSAAGPIASYSVHDVATLQAEGHIAVHVPLAYDAQVEVRPRPSHEVVFVGARYPARESLVHALQGAGVPVRAYGRDWSGHLVDRFRTWRVGSPRVPSGRDLTRRDAYAVMAGAVAALNVHGDQDGFTMRTFEAAGVGAVEIMDRPDVCTLYDPGTEVAVFTSPQEAIELAVRAARDRAWAEGIRASGRRRTMAEHTFDHRAAALEALWA